MQLSDDIKAKIQAEYDAWQAGQYAGKDKKDRQQFGQFFTPPALSIKMLEKFNSLDGNILDPTLGAGGLIAAAVLAGANPYMCYGIELDKDVLAIAQLRLAKLGVPPWHLKQGDALDPKSYEFTETEQHVPAMFAVIHKEDANNILFMLVKNAKMIKEVKFSKPEFKKFKDVVQKLKDNGIKIVKI